MHTSQAIARLLGPILTVIGLGLLVNGPAYREIARELTSSYFFIYVSGVLALLGGLAILNAHSVWTRDWRIIITALGLVMTVVGVFRILAPPFVSIVGGTVLQQPYLILATGIVLIGIGGFLSFKGYGA